MFSRRFITVMDKTKWVRCTFLGLLVAVAAVFNESGAVVLTPNHLGYTLYPMTGSFFSVRIRAAQDAHILLTYHPNDTNPVYEIFLGGWKNTRSVIRKNHTRPDKQIFNVTGMLSAKEFRGFWVNCSQGLVAVGKEGETIPFMQWKDPKPFEVRYFGIRTAWGNTGEWIIDNPSVFLANADQYDLRLGLPGFVSVDVVGSTMPSLTWKIHDFIISDGNYDPNGCFYATKAYMEAIGMWKARLFIFNVTQEDAEKNILLTTRFRGQNGTKTYVVNLHLSNTTTGTGDETACLTAADFNATSYSMTPQDATSKQPIYKTTSNIPVKMNTTSAFTSIKQLGSTSNILNTSLKRQIIPTQTSKSTISNKIPLTTGSTRYPSQTVKSYVLTTGTSKSFKRNNISQPGFLSTSKSLGGRNVTKVTIMSTKISFKKVTATTLPIILFGKTTTRVMQKNDMATRTLDMRGTTLKQNAENGDRQAQCRGQGVKSTTLPIVIGMLVLIIVAIVSIVSRATFKYKKMTGSWWFTAKSQASILMDEMNDRDSLVQQSPY